MGGVFKPIICVVSSKSDLNSQLLKKSSNIEFYGLKTPRRQDSVIFCWNFCLFIEQVESNPSKNRFTPINSRSNFLYVKSDTIFWFPSAELWDKSGQNYDFSSYLKGLKIGSKLWVYRRITKNYGFEHPPRTPKNNGLKHMCDTIKS